MTFDYRGWGASESRIILVKPHEERTSDLRFTAEVQEVREVVDPIDQTTDLDNAVSWVYGEPQCDRERIALWGSSYSGGHVVYVAARDPRVGPRSARCRPSTRGSCSPRPRPANKPSPKPRPARTANSATRRRAPR